MLEVIYFEAPGYAEPTRLCLEMIGKPWKNTIVDWDGYQKLKEAGELPWGFLPVLKTSQGTIAESGAMMRYAASLAGLDSDDLYTQGKINEIIDVIDGWRAHFTPTFYIDDLEDRCAARQALFEPGAKMDAGLKDLETLFENSPTGWIAGTEGMSLADVKAFLNTFMMFSGQFDGIDEGMIQTYPLLLEYHKKVSNHPSVKSYYDIEDKWRWVFKPDAFSNQ